MSDCCGRLLDGEPAPDAEALMRSRYCAFVVRNESYLLQTWHQTTRPASLTLDNHQKWLGLKVVSASTSGDHAEVEFIARYRIGGTSAERMSERSRFVREGGRWYYVDGDLMR
jgi:SEC-C motif-containing protein